MKTSLPLLVALAALSVACVTKSPIEQAREPRVRLPNELPPGRVTFEAAQALFVKHDRAKDWNAKACAEVGAAFEQVAADLGKFAVARYDAGLAYERCGMTADAKKQFALALEDDPKLHQARTKLALLAWAASGEKAHDAAIAELRQAAIVDAKFQNAEALVHLGMIYLRRGKTGEEAGDKLADDLARAQRFAQTALAVDDAYMPAYNLLALQHLETARRQVGASAGKLGGPAGGMNVGARRADKRATQTLELAALVCSQAIRKNGTYAPLHNTAGMIHVELGNLTAAVAFFNAARKLDPAFYEAQMNVGAVNLQFRGFAQAEEAYRAVVRARPEDYEARLGLALALRGQIDEQNFEAKVAAAASELDQAKKIAPDRPETYFNQAILAQEYQSKVGGDAQLVVAKGLFEKFVERATKQGGFDDAVKRAKERVADIQQILVFNAQTIAQRDAAKADAKNEDAKNEAGEGAEAK